MSESDKPRPTVMLVMENLFLETTRPPKVIADVQQPGVSLASWTCMAFAVDQAWKPLGAGVKTQMRTTMDDNGVLTMTLVESVEFDLIADRDCKGIGFALQGEADAMFHVMVSQTEVRAGDRVIVHLLVDEF